MGEVNEKRLALRDGALQFLKFCLVGGSGVLVNLTVFNATLLVLHSHRPAAGDYLANGLGFLVAVISNYYLDRRWTFRSDGAVASEFAKFLAVSIAAYALNLGVFALFRSQLGPCSQSEPDPRHRIRHAIQLSGQQTVELPPCQQNGRVGAASRPGGQPRVQSCLAGTFPGIR